MKALLTITEKKFNINNTEYLARLEKRDSDNYIVIYKQNKELALKLYTGSIEDDSKYLSEAEDLIEDLILKSNE